jgi:hypothetical protein
MTRRSVRAGKRYARRGGAGGRGCAAGVRGARRRAQTPPYDETFFDGVERGEATKFAMNLAPCEATEFAMNLSPWSRSPAGTTRPSGPRWRS